MQWEGFTVPQCAQVLLVGTNAFQHARRIRLSDLPTRFFGTGMDKNL
jgi:hypothetical protein